MGGGVHAHERERINVSRALEARRWEEDKGGELVVRMEH